MHTIFNLIDSPYGVIVGILLIMWFVGRWDERHPGDHTKLFNDKGEWIDPDNR